MVAQAMAPPMVAVSAPAAHMCCLENPTVFFAHHGSLATQLTNSKVYLPAMQATAVVVVVSAWQSQPRSRAVCLHLLLYLGTAAIGVLTGRPDGFSQATEVAVVAMAVRF